MWWQYWLYSGELSTVLLCADGKFIAKVCVYCVSIACVLDLWDSWIFFATSSWLWAHTHTHTHTHTTWNWLTDAVVTATVLLPPSQHPQPSVFPLLYHLSVLSALQEVFLFKAFK